jgi:hypothetical protein
VRVESDAGRPSGRGSRRGTGRLGARRRGSS